MAISIVKSLVKRIASKLTTRLRKQASKSESVSIWTKAEVYVQVVILFVALLALVYAQDASQKSNDAAKTANDINQRGIDLQNKALNYSMQIISYPIIAEVEAKVPNSYLNTSSSPTIVTKGFLNVTFIVSSPDIIRISIENMSIRKISDVARKLYSNGTIGLDTEELSDFDITKFDEWLFYFETNLPSRAYPLPTSDRSNFTYYTGNERIATVSSSLPIIAQFYLKPNFSISYNYWEGSLGYVTANVNVFNMVTKEPLPSITVTTWLFARVYPYEPIE